MGSSVSSAMAYSRTRLSEVRTSNELDAVPRGCHSTEATRGEPGSEW